MTKPSAAALLDVWEASVALAPAQRALALCLGFAPDASLDQLARLSIGERDARLIDLHERLFGPRFEACVVCPRCDEQLELSFDADDVRSEAGSTASSLSFDVDGYIIESRCVTTLDLLTLAGIAPSEQRTALLRRAVVHAERAGEPVQLLDLPDSALLAAEAVLAAADAQAETLLGLDCPGCGHAWQATFDIASFLWSEVTAWAARLVREVHLLARAYGWSENDILQLSARRRQLYLEMVEG